MSQKDCELCEFVEFYCMWFEFHLDAVQTSTLAVFHCDRQTRFLYFIKQECIFASVTNVIYMLHRHYIGQKYVDAKY